MKCKLLLPLIVALTWSAQDARAFFVQWKEHDCTFSVGDWKFGYCEEWFNWSNDVTAIGYLYLGPFKPLCVSQSETIGDATVLPPPGCIRYFPLAMFATSNLLR
jgi:hypothetical protein